MDLRRATLVSQLLYAIKPCLVVIKADEPASGSHEKTSTVAQLSHRDELHGGLVLAKSRRL